MGLARATFTAWPTTVAMAIPSAIAAAITNGTGVSADYVRRLEQNGMTRLSADQLVHLRLAGFEPRR
jgi:hypothetical protein